MGACRRKFIKIFSGFFLNFSLVYEVLVSLRIPRNRNYLAAVSISKLAVLLLLQ